MLALEKSETKDKSFLLLDVSENNIQDISALILEDLQPHLLHLEKLELRSNKITSLPDDLHIVRSATFN